MISFAIHTVIRLRASVVEDAYHNQVLDWDNPTRMVIPGCRVQPLDTDAYDADRNAVIVRLRLILPPGVDVVSTDRIEWRGAPYELDGAVGEVDSATGALAHGEAILRKVDG